MGLRGPLTCPNLRNLLRCKYFFEMDNFVKCYLQVPCFSMPWRAKFNCARALVGLRGPLTSPCANLRNLHKTQIFSEICNFVKCYFKFGVFLCPGVQISIVPERWWDYVVPLRFHVQMFLAYVSRKYFFEMHNFVECYL